MELEDLKDTINNRLDAGQVVDKNEAICSIDTSLCILNAIQLNIAETLSEKLEELTTDTENISGYLKRIAAALERPAETEKWPEDVRNDVLEMLQNVCKITGNIDDDDAGKANDIICDIIHAIENPGQWFAARKGE